MAAKKVFQGVVTSDKMPKTVVVLVTQVKRHKKYKKQYRVSKKFKADDQNNDYRTGDTVEITESNPISKEKRWKVVRKIK